MGRAATDKYGAASSHDGCLPRPRPGQSTSSLLGSGGCRHCEVRMTSRSSKEEDAERLDLGGRRHLAPRGLQSWVRGLQMGSFGYDALNFFVGGIFEGQLPVFRGVLRWPDLRLGEDPKSDCICGHRPQSMGAHAAAFPNCNGALMSCTVSRGLAPIVRRLRTGVSPVQSSVHASCVMFRGSPPPYV